MAAAVTLFVPVISVSILGNTYSLLDTKRLIDLGEEAEEKERALRRTSR